MLSVFCDLSHNLMIYIGCNRESSVNLNLSRCKKCIKIQLSTIHVEKNSSIQYINQAAGFDRASIKTLCKL